MIIEKTNTAQQLMEQMSANAPKVGFLRNETLAAALSYLEQKGLPGNKQEDYKYFNADAILKKEFKQVGQRLLAAGNIKHHKLEDTITLVIENGNYSEALSDKIVLKGLHIESFDNLDARGKSLIASSAKVDSDAFVALNTAFSGNGLYIRVEKDCELQIPLHLLYISACEGEAVVNPRCLVEIEEGASATLIEEQILTGHGKVFTNYLSEKFVAQGGKLISYLFQHEGPNGFSVNTSQVQLEKDGHYDNTTITLSGQAVRNNHQVVLAGTGGQAHLNGLFVLRGSQLVDNHTLMDHQVPHCESNELYKGLISDKATGVFNGKIFVRRDAQKTNAYQSSKNILLSDDATINTKPQLEIYADDVKCSHGTSTGKIDENALFYLNARGIGKESAKKLLLSSFAQEVVAFVDTDSLKERIDHLLEAEL